MKQLKIIISGGGTGGHIFPAIAIANELKKLISDVEILFVGALGKMEMEKVPALGYKIIGIPIAGFQRKFSLSNFKLPFLILKSLIKTRKIIIDFKPDVIVGTGGYASGPLLKVATAMNIPTLIQEQNSYAGITNKLLSKKVNKICVAYEGMAKFFPKEKIILTGNPVREDIININDKKIEGISFFKLDSKKKIVLIIGGSLGAKGINESISLGLNKFKENQIQIIWQTGKNFFETAKKIIAERIEEKDIKVVDFISRMDLAYAVADIVISRAGAGAISELCIVQKPSILVPLKTAAEDHQTKNAMALVNNEAACLVNDIDAKNSLVNETILLINDVEKQKTFINNIKHLAFHNSANTISLEILKLVNYKLS